MQKGTFDTDAYEAFQAKLIQEERQVVQQMMVEAEREAAEAAAPGEAPARLHVGYDIKDDATPIMDIQDEEKRITIQELSSDWK